MCHCGGYVRQRPYVPCGISISGEGCVAKSYILQRAFLPFCKRLTPEMLGEINEMILRDAKERQAKENKDDDDSDDALGEGGNSGTLIVDATCTPSHSLMNVCWVLGCYKENRNPHDQTEQVHNCAIKTSSMGHVSLPSVFIWFYNTTPVVTKQ